MTASSGLPVLPAPEPLQVTKRAVDNENNIRTAATIATIRPAAGNMSLAPERHGPVTATTGLNEDACAVLKHDRTLGLIGSR